MGLPIFDCELCLGGARDRLVVRGCVDDSTASLFRDELYEARRTAMGGLDIDVQLVGLSSPGARLLRGAVASTDRRATVRLLADPGTPAAALLERYGLPHEPAARAGTP